MFFVSLQIGLFLIMFIFIGEKNIKPILLFEYDLSNHFTLDFDKS